ncbi:MAG: PadR family transcriptional regulator [Phycisphaerales bacterium]|jgi:transcriptional regulator
MAPTPNERAAILQGTLDLLILRTLAAGANHGYGIAKRLRETSDEVILVEEGTLYPAVHRLEKRGFVESEWQITETNRRAKFYRLTRDGRAKLKTDTVAWETLSGAIDRVLGASTRSGITGAMT